MTSSPRVDDKTAISDLDRPRPGKTAILLIIIASATLVSLPIFIRGFPAGIDADRHYAWAVQFNEALNEPGVFYPRWLSTANNGQGSPVTLYYPPLQFFVTAGFNRLAGDTLTALGLSCWLSLVISGLTMYRFARGLFARSWSIAAAVFYIASPYHLFDLYQ